MSRQDPGAATGQGVYPPLRRCVCGESEGVHTLTDGKRRGIPATDCKRFEASGEVLAFSHEVRWVPGESS